MLTTVHSRYTARPLCWSTAAMSPIDMDLQYYNNLGMCDVMKRKCFTLTTSGSKQIHRANILPSQANRSPLGALKIYGRGSICQTLWTRAVLRRPRGPLIYRLRRSSATLHLGTADNLLKEEAVGSVAIDAQSDFLTQPLKYPGEHCSVDDPTVTSCEK